MAKKITITGSNLLTSLSDDWGGKNTSGSAETHYGTSVPSGAEWGMNRGEVERFIRQMLTDATITESGFNEIFG